jgi:hypothetical protein
MHLPSFKILFLLLLLLVPVVPEDVFSVERDKGLFGPSHHALLGLADPDAGVVVLLVGFVGALGIADLKCLV